MVDSSRFASTLARRITRRLYATGTYTSIRRITVFIGCCRIASAAIRDESPLIRLEYSAMPAKPGSRSRSWASRHVPPMPAHKINCWCDGHPSPPPKRPVPAPTPTPVCRSAPDSFRVRITPLSGGPAAGEEVTQNGKKEHMTTRPIDDEICATCFACGRGYCKGDGRFCSTRCREAFDAGFPPAKDESNYIRAMTNVLLAAWHVVAGPPGIEIGARFYE